MRTSHQPTELPRTAKPSARRLRGAFFVAIVLCSVLPPAPAVAGARVWSTNGPYGGSIVDLTTHPSNPSVIFAGTFGGGLFKSTDWGETWHRSTPGTLPNVDVFDVAFARSAPAIVYAATSSGLWKSTNEGATWSYVSPIMDCCHTVAIHPLQPSVVYAGASFGTFKSSDGGVSWTELFDTTQRAVRAGELLISLSDPNTVYGAGTPWWRSTNGGVTWVRLEGLIMGGNSALVHPTIASTVYMGNSNTLYRSTDSGDTWTPVIELPPLHNADALAVDPTNFNTMYLGTWGGIRRSLDGGTTWSLYNEGLYFDQGVTQLAVSADGSSVFAGLWHHGVYKRSASPSQWVERNQGLIASDIRAVAVAPSKGSVVYAVANRQGVAKSTNGGASWSWVGLRGVGLNEYKLAIHPRNHRIVYLAAHTSLYKTTDGGKTWKRKLTAPYAAGGMRAVAIASSNPRIVYAATAEGGLFRSRDEGSSWKRTRLNAELNLYSVAVHPRRPNTVYVGTRSETVVKTTDGGKTWYRSLPFAHIDPLTIVIDPSKPRIVYVGCDADGVYRTTNGGRSWRLMNGGDPPESAAGIVIDPRNPRVVYAGGNEGAEYPSGIGVFRSTDRGQTWTPMMEGLTTTPIGALAMSPSGSMLHAGSSTHFGGGGVFTYRF